MYEYSTIQWLFIFYFYCFFGWCFESAYVSIKSRRLVNRGFMRGPFLPLYGSGAIMMLLVSRPFQDNIILVYVAGCVGATVLEYVTGVVMEALFKVRYWDYSNQPFNFQGHICLGSSLAWGGLTIAMTEIIHKPVEGFVLSIPNGVLTPVTLVLTALLCADFALAFKTAMDLRDVLVKMEKAREELMHIQKRLDVIIAVTNESFSNKKDAFAENISQYREEISENISRYKEGISENFSQYKEEISESISQYKENIAGNIETRVEDLKENIEEKLEQIKKQVQARPGDFLENFREELLELRVNYRKSVEDRERLSGVKDFLQRDLIRSNPTMSSKYFKEALEELKRHAGENRKK